MTFLAPLFLLGLFAALIPIAIHLIRRDKPPKVMFSSLRFLKQTSRKLIFFQQIQQWLLLLMRAAVVCLIVFAFARPYISQTLSSIVDANPRSVVVMLDVSMSMRYGDRFEEARKAVIDVLEGLNNGDEAALITFANAPVSVRELTTDISELRSYVDSLDEPGYRATKFLPTLRLANQLLESSRYENRSVYLVSDYQINALLDSDSEWDLAPGVGFTGIDVGEEQSTNLVITDVRSPNRLIEDVSEHEILVRVRSAGTVHLDQAQVTLTLDGNVVSRAQADLTDKSEVVVSLLANFDQQGTHLAEVRVAGDDHTDDNSFWFTVDVLPKINVLLVNGESSENWYDDEGHWFGLALSSAVQSPFSLKSVNPSELSGSLLEQYDVAVLLNVGDLSSSQAKSIEEYVNSGGSLLIALGDRVNAADYNQDFANITPAKLLDQGDLLADDYLVIADFDRRHPILRPLTSDWTVRFQGYWSLETEPGSDVLMRFDNAKPALVERSVGQGTVLLFASSLDPEWNNLPLQGLYLPFVHETLRHLAHTTDKQRAYEIGDIIDLQPEDGSSVLVSEPSGDTRELSGNSSGNPSANSADNSIGNFNYLALVPGMVGTTVQTRGRQGQVTEYYAINADSDEANLAKIAVVDVHDLVINADTKPMQSPKVRTAQLLKEMEKPQRLWWWVLGLVMVLLLAEAHIANRTYR